MSPDHRTPYTVSEEDGRTCLALGTAESRCFEGIGLHHIVFSPDSRHLAYPVQVGDSWFVVRDGVPGPGVEGIGEIRFSPDSRRIAYSALMGGAWRVILDDEPGAAFEALFSGSLSFDPTGTHLAFSAQRSGRAVVVVDGDVGPHHEAVGPVRFSSDGVRYAYVARDGGRAHLLVGDTVVATHDAISAVRLSPSGAIAYAFLYEAGWWVGGDLPARGPYTSIRALEYPRAEVGPSYVVGEDGRERVVFGSSSGPWHEQVDVPVFAAGGGRWGYVGHGDSASVVVLDGVVTATESRASDLVLNPDGSRYAYVATRGGLRYVVHDGGERGFDVVVPGTLVFPGRGDRWAVLAGRLDREELFVVVEGESTTRRFEWSEIGRIVVSSMADPTPPPPDDQLRAWVAAEASLLLWRR